MTNQLCFIIENKKLFLDKVLVSFNETPIFFVCRDEERNLYLVLCSDIEELNYIVVKQSLTTIWRMLTKKTSMRAALLDCECFWHVASGVSIEEDRVELLKKSQMDNSILPFEGALFEAIEKEDKQYVDKMTSEYLNALSFGNSTKISDNFEDSEFFLEELGEIVSFEEVRPACQGSFGERKTNFTDSMFPEKQNNTVIYKTNLYKELPIPKNIEKDFDYELDAA